MNTFSYLYTWFNEGSFRHLAIVHWEATVWQSIKQIVAKQWALYSWVPNANATLIELVCWKLPLIKLPHLWAPPMRYRPIYPQAAQIHYALINWNPDPPPTPGLCGAMWGIFMVFEVMVSPWGWGISQDLLSVFIWQSGNEVGIWLVPSLLTVISSRDHRYFDVSGFEFKFPNRWFSRYAIVAMLVDGVNKRSLITWLCLSTSIC